MSSTQSTHPLARRPLKSLPRRLPKRSVVARPAPRGWQAAGPAKRQRYAFINTFNPVATVVRTHMPRGALTGTSRNLGVAMKKFVRTKLTNTGAADITIDFGAASAQIAQVLDPEVYQLRIESARVIQNNQK